MIHVRSGNLDVAVKELRSAAGPIMLLLHGLGESAPTDAPGLLTAWPGAIFAMDFVGHGESSWAWGGGYSAEALMADVDCVLSTIGPATIVGRGLGGFVGLLAGGARPHLTRGVVVMDGAGIAGGGPEKPSPRLPTTDFGSRVTGPSAWRSADPVAVDELASEVRDPEYAAYFAEHLGRGDPDSAPVFIAAAARPAWIVRLLERQLGLAIAPRVALERAALAARRTNPSASRRT